MKRKVNNIIARIKRKKAVGILYNMPEADQAALHNKLLDGKHIVFNAQDAYTSVMLLYRLGSRLKMKGLSFDQLPGLIDGKIICITGADIIKTSFAKVFDDSHKYRIPLLLLMNNGSKMTDIRKLPVYRRIFTIEQDYKTL